MNFYLFTCKMHHDNNIIVSTNYIVFSVEIRYWKSYLYERKYNEIKFYLDSEYKYICTTFY